MEARRQYFFPFLHLIFSVRWILLFNNEFYKQEYLDYSWVLIDDYLIDLDSLDSMELFHFKLHFNFSAWNKKFI